MKSLRTVQVLAKIGKVLSKIVFICSIVGAALCVAGIVSYAFLGDGGVRTLGIVDICVGLGASVVCGIVLAVMKVVGQTASNVSYGGSFSAGLGIAMIVVSVLCDYGAEIRRGE